jgi:4-oxalocrotonate tautomerase
MPIVHVRLLEGRTQAQLDVMYEAMTETLCRTVDCTPEEVRIFVTHIPADGFAVAGRSIAARNREKQGR